MKVDGKEGEGRKTGERGEWARERQKGEKEIMLCMVTARATNSRDENYTLRLPRFVA